MQQFIREVGRGKKGAQDLSYEQARQAAQLIFDGEASDAQIGAFLIAERVKSETTEEHLAFVEEARQRTNKILHRKSGVLDCAGAYDGRGKSFAATIPVAAVLAAAGQPVVLHGSHSLPPKYGVSLLEILQELHVSVEREPARLAEVLEQHGLIFAETELLCEPLRALRQIRKDLGVRTLLNYTEKFLNVADADYLVAGVFHTSALDKAAELTLRLGYRKAMIVQGIDGSEDIPTNRPSAFLIIENGKSEKQLIDPKQYGVDEPYEVARLTATEQAQLITSVLQGEASFRNMVLLNSGLRLWFTGQSESMEAGIEQAKQLLDTGKAWEQFQQWRSF
ncbi:anthranilate phosphoribosyltransferase [Effusibacillus dendaii]|uniref:Anthranilate phosphoribosyltransferase n=1 Tax=Effusibacillus dendaii TaxID=2743772 RepID=A0A7I8D526_9BACL|nr:anthranilate phosphoribosyltransferase [Effusibacillus dendaii]BCJ85194.1 anthranilate phosphoribosyltransferase [Effusibacillus dendaii]